MAKRPIRVLVVDDSSFMRKFLSDAVNKDPDLVTAGMAADAYEARDKILEVLPDVMTLDMDMPRMSGLSFLRQLMPQHPMPVIVVTSTRGLANDAAQAGAADYILKPNISNEVEREAFVSELIIKIKLASITKRSNPRQADAPAEKAQRPDSSKLVIALGASTGGTDATNAILKDLPAELPGIVMVQHMPPVFTKMYAERLNNSCPMMVKEAEDGDEVLPGRALVAPGDYQMQLVRRGSSLRVRVFKGDKVSGHCPSVDVLFSSVAQVMGKNALGILLTGMGADGAKGLLEMKEAGASTIGQNQETCVVYGMPMVAKNLGAVTFELPLDKIADKVRRWYKDISR